MGGSDLFKKRRENEQRVKGMKDWGATLHNKNNNVDKVESGKGGFITEGEATKKRRTNNNNNNNNKQSPSLLHYTLTFLLGVLLEEEKKRKEGVQTTTTTTTKKAKNSHRCTT